ARSPQSSASYVRGTDDNTEKGEVTMKRTTALLGLATSLLLTMNTAKAEPDKVNFVLDWVIYGRSTPYFVSLEKGFFAKRNIDPKIERGYGSHAKREGLGSGQGVI